MSLVPEPRALAVDALSQDWQGRSMYMFPPFPLLNKAAQDHPGGWGDTNRPPGDRHNRGFHTYYVCVWTTHASFHTRIYLERQVVPSARWRFLCSTTKKQDFPKRSPSSQKLLEDPLRIECMTTGQVATGKGFDPLGSTAAQIAAFLYELFVTQMSVATETDPLPASTGHGNGSHSCC